MVDPDLIIKRHGFCGIYRNRQKNDSTIILYTAIVNKLSELLTVISVISFLKQKYLQHL